MKLYTLCLIFVAIGMRLTPAQAMQMTGTVINSEDKQSLPGTATIVKDANTDSTTDEQVKYSLTLPADAREEYRLTNTTYGINVYRSTTGSGYGPSMNIHFNAQTFNRVFELGVMFDNKKMKGFEFLYKLYFGFHLAHFYEKPLKPYVYYNFMYRTPTEIIVDRSLLNADNVNPAAIGGKITTFEHAVGLGAKLRLLKKLYLESNAGFGVYLGSRYQGTTPKTWGFHLHNCGFVPSFKLGLGFQF